MKWLFIAQRQNSNVKVIDWQPARSRLAVQVFTSLPNIQAPLPDTPGRAGHIFSKLCLTSSPNVVDRDTILADKLKNHSLVGFHPPMHKI
jgi:hypothetical protein